LRYTTNLRGTLALVPISTHPIIQPLNNLNQLTNFLVPNLIKYIVGTGIKILCSRNLVAVDSSAEECDVTVEKPTFILKLGRLGSTILCSCNAIYIQRIMRSTPTISSLKVWTIDVGNTVGKAARTERRQLFGSSTYVFISC
jgi:hypothetical protein